MNNRQGKKIPDLLPLTAAPKSVCILRLSALGDATHVLPLISALRKYWPSTQITWILGKLEYQLLKHIEDIEFIVFDKKHSVQAYRKLKTELKGRYFDVLLQMQVALRANLVSRLINSPIRLGWDDSRARDWHHKFINHQIAEVAYQHQVQGFLSFARRLGLAANEPSLDLQPSQQALEFAAKYIASDRETLVISPCSSHSLRNWSNDAYAAIADYAIGKLDMQVLLSGGPSALELDTAAQISTKMQHHAVNLVGKDSLQQSLGILSQASLLISPDSGPVHIANALGTPVLGLYAATWSRRSGPYNSLDLCVDRFPEAARQYRNKQARELRWGSKIEKPGVMDLITVDDVIEKLEQWRNPVIECSA